MRLIDADALVERWKRIASISWNETAITSWSNAYKEIISEIEEEPTIESVPMWIPCSKEQPPKPEDVTRQEYIVQIKGVIEPYIASWNGEKWFYDEFGGYEVEEGNILAWMPLPPAYKGE